MNVVCPMCNVPMDAPDGAGGTTQRCPTCGHQFVAGGGAPRAQAAPPQPQRRPCPLCGQSVAAGASKCPHCRGTIGSVQCPACAESVPAGAAACPFCNTPMRGQPAAVRPQTAPGQSAAASKLLCGLLAFFLPIGIHRFLMGHTGTGIAQFLLAIFCGVGILWSWIDGIMIFTGSLRMADGRELAE